MLEDTKEWRDKDLRNLTIEETVLYCRSDTQYRQSVLGFSQQHYELAYNEYIKNRNVNRDISYYFNKMYNLDTDLTYTKEQLIEFFKQRNEELK